VIEFSQQILPMVEAGKKPQNVKDWKQNVVVAYLYQTLATIEDYKKNADKALEYHTKALTADPANAASAFACGKIHYDRYGAATKAYQAFPDADQAAAADKKPDAKPEVVAALDKVNKEADAVIECWAKFLALTTTNPPPARAQVEQAVTSLYKYRHNDSTEGLQQLIDKYKSGGPTTSTPPQPSNTGAAKPPAN
jgi:lipopolysaccharide biosynthesis regulator YciM